MRPGGWGMTSAELVQGTDARYELGKDLVDHLDLNSYFVKKSHGFRRRINTNCLVHSVRALCLWAWNGCTKTLPMAVPLICSVLTVNFC